MPSWSRRRDESEALISVAQAASLLGVHPNTIRTWTDSGRLPAYRINIRGDRRFRRRDVERLLAEGPMAAPVAAADPAARDHELTVLARLARAGIGSSPVAVCRVAVDALRTQLGVARVAIYLVTREELRLETHAGYDVAPPATLPLESIDPAPPADAPRDPAAAELRLPLRASGDLLGALVVADPTGTSLQARERTFLATVADALAVAVHNARLLARARREVTRARALRGVTQELTGQLDLSSVLDDIVDRTKSLFEADKAGLWLLNDGDHPFELAAARGIGEAFQASVRGLTLDSSTVGVRAIVEKRTCLASRR